MDGTEVGLDLKAVIEILQLYGECSQEMFEKIIYLWNIKQESKDGNEIPRS